MGIVLSAARAALKAAPAPLNSNKFWSYAALNAIDKTKYLVMARNGIFTPSPHTEMQLHGHHIDDKDGRQSFLPFGQAGWIVNTAKHKKKLEDRATQANYLRCINKDKYQVFRRDTRSLTTVRTNEFVLALEQDKNSSEESKDQETNLPKTPLIPRDTQKQRERPSPTRVVHTASGIDAQLAHTYVHQQQQ